MNQIDSKELENVLILVRHTKVEEQFQRVCYGASDIGLSDEGEVHACELAKKIGAMNPTQIFHSGLQRSQRLAELISIHTDIPMAADPRLAEMNFGEWELKTWDQIFADVGHDIGRLASEPDTYAPPGGETVNALRDRMVSWARALPHQGRIVAISHGGPISALRRTLAEHELVNWTDLVPAHGEILTFQLPVFE